MFTATAMVATATEPPTPFHVYGWVKYSSGIAVLGPNVNITNLNTTENYTVETNASYNYYQVITSSCNVSEGDVLNFSADDGVNSSDLHEVMVEQGNMTEGGLFEQNLTIQKGICGDVIGPGATPPDGEITVYDAVYIIWHIADPVHYPLPDPWAADVIGPGATPPDGEITVYDAVYIIWHIADPVHYPLRCAGV